MKPAAYPALHRMDRMVGLVAPASPFNRDRFKTGLEILGGLVPGLRLRADGSIFAARAWLAGDDAHRAGHLQRVFGHPGVDMVWPVRGGYGSSRLLPLLDMEKLAASRRCFMGFSDLTCLLNQLAMRGTVTLHGPVINQLPALEPDSLADLRAILRGPPPLARRPYGRDPDAGQGLRPFDGRQPEHDLPSSGHSLGPGS